jgi:hypothetical protein
MPKHRAAIQIEDADAETQSCHTVRIAIAETQAITINGQGRHSQERNSRG